MTDSRLEALAVWSPEAAAAVQSAGGSPGGSAEGSAERSPGAPVVRLDRARSGEISAFVSTPDGERRLHSRYDPRRETERLVASLPEASTLVVYGLGAGWLPRLVLSGRRSCSVAVLEPDPRAIRLLLDESVGPELLPALRSGRLRFALSPEQLGRAVGELYQPILLDGLAEHQLAGRFGSEDDALLRNARAAVTSARTAAEADRLTIGRSARAWWTHTLETTLVTDPARWLTGLERFRRLRDAAPVRVVVAAAGPSLDAVPDSDLRPSGGCLVAVDTAVPALLARGIRPDMVVSLDAQGWSALHLRRRLPDSTLVVADLGSPWAISRPGPAVLPLIGGHPLHRLLVGAGIPGAVPARPGRNVTLAAVTLARHLSSDVVVHGVDGGFPAAATYARGTYHHRWAQARACRRQPVEHRFAERVYPVMPAPTLHSDTHRPHFRTTAMRDTRAEILALAAGTIPDAGVGLASPSGSGFNARAFWHEHRTAVSATLRSLPEEASTPELMLHLGPHGRAHLPLAAGALFGRLRDIPGARGSLDMALRWVLTHLAWRLEKGFPFDPKDR